MFRSYSDHLQGAHVFLVKVTDFKTFVKNVKVNMVMRQHNIHTPNVMLPHHHIDFYIFNKF